MEAYIEDQYWTYEYLVENHHPDGGDRWLPTKHDGKVIRFASRADALASAKEHCECFKVKTRPARCITIIQPTT